MCYSTWPCVCVCVITSCHQPFSIGNGRSPVTLPGFRSCLIRKQFVTVITTLRSLAYSCCNSLGMCIISKFPMKGRESRVGGENLEIQVYPKVQFYTVVLEVMIQFVHKIPSVTLFYIQVYWVFVRWEGNVGGRKWLWWGGGDTSSIRA